MLADRRRTCHHRQRHHRCLMHGAAVEEPWPPPAAHCPVEGVIAGCLLHVPVVEAFTQLGDFRGQSLQLGVQPPDLVVTH